MVITVRFRNTSNTSVIIIEIGDKHAITERTTNISPL